MPKEKVDAQIVSDPGLGEYLAMSGVYPKAGMEDAVKPKKKKSAKKAPEEVPEVVEESEEE